jgi:hypothetical protein
MTLFVRGFKGLKKSEYVALLKYFDESDIGPLTELIGSNDQLSNGFRLFLVEFIKGTKTKPLKPGRHRTLWRDRAVYGHVDHLIRFKGLSKTDALLKTSLDDRFGLYPHDLEQVRKAYDHGKNDEENAIGEWLPDE